MSKLSIQSKHKVNVEHRKNDNNSNNYDVNKENKESNFVDNKENKEMRRSKSVIEVINKDEMITLKAEVLNKDKDKVMPQKTQIDIKTLLLKYWLKIQIYSMIKIALIVKILHDKKHKIKTKTTNTNTNNKSKYSKHKLFYIKLYNIIKINVYKTILSSLSHKLNIKHD